LADDVSINMALRLRGSANACNRSAEQNRRALTKATRTRDQDQIPNPASPETPAPPAEVDPEPFLGIAAAQVLAAEAQARLQTPKPRPSRPTGPTPELLPPHLKDAERRNQEMWAIAMVKEAGEIHASIPNLPPAERKAASIRAASLSGTAHQLLSATDGTQPGTA
jgi:hypothetical protein